MLSVYFVLTVGIIQVLIGFNIIPKTVLIGELLYSNTLSSYHSIYPVVTRRLYSTFIEPSYCSAFLIGAFWFIALNDFKKKKKFAYTYEHREDCDYKSLNLTLRGLLFADREERF